MWTSYGTGVFGSYWSNCKAWSRQENYRRVSERNYQGRIDDFGCKPKTIRQSGEPTRDLN